MTGGQFPGIVRDALGYLTPALPASPDTFGRSNAPRMGLGDSATALVTQVMTAVPVELAAGDLITNLTFVSGATAMGVPTNWWFALYDTSAVPALIAQTADQLAAAWAAETVQTKALSVPAAGIVLPYRVPKTGIYWVACMVKATTVPSLVGSRILKPVLAGERNLAVSSGAALVGVAPATLAAPVGLAYAPACVAS